MFRRTERLDGWSWRARVEAIARASFRRRRSSGDLARLIHDSLVEADASPDDHYLTFQHADLTVHLHVAATPDHTDLRGRLYPANSRTAALQPHSRGRTRLAASTPSGAFAFSNVDHGLVRIRLDAPDGPSIWSDWFRV